MLLKHTRSDSKLVDYLFLLPMKVILKSMLNDDHLRNIHELVERFFKPELVGSYYRGIVRLIVARKPG
ncbi:hypothetical protein [Thermococcus sp.]|uniref:hypothetical protein n=1 Tax=Thermococcus sp. TaxID=35749 RepID=UPI0026156C44|nr:hypothetical protein [Thermococcus sp.]